MRRHITSTRESRFSHYLILGALFLSVCILLSSGVLAGYAVSDAQTTLQKDYAAGDVVKGKINISFSGQKNTNFTSGFYGGMSVLDALAASGAVKGTDYSCDPISCTKGYAVDTSALVKTLNVDGKRIFAMKVDENISDIRAFSFNVTSDIGARCARQLDIDVFDDGVIDYYNTSYTDTPCGEKNFGCYNDNSGDVKQAILTNIPDDKYCEVIDMPSAPAYKLGAMISGDDGGLVQFRLYNYSNMSTAETALCATGDSAKCGCQEKVKDGEVSCVLPYSSREPFQALVCVVLDSSTGNKLYKINYKSGGDDLRCGGQGNPATGPLTLHADYQIYSQGMQSGTIKNVQFNDNWYAKLNQGKSFKDALEAYFSERYGLQCPKNGCVVPIVVEGDSQQVSVFDAHLFYKNNQGLLESNDIYEASEKPFTISSGYRIMPLEPMNFLVPAVNGQQTFELKLDGKTIVGQSITSKAGFAFDVNPKYVPVGQKITYEVQPLNNASIVSSSVWSFGDGGSISSASGSAEHVYSANGNYTLQVSAKNTLGDESAKSVKIYVGGAKASADTILAKYLQNILSIKSALLTYPEWVQSELKKSLQLETIEAGLAKVKKDYGAISATSSDDAYVPVVSAMLGLSIPERLEVSNRGKVPVVAGYDAMNPQLFVEVTKGKKNVSDVASARSLISDWMDKNYDIDITYETVSAISALDSRELISVYNVTITPKKSFSGKVYLLIAYPFNNTKFKTGGTTKPLMGGRATALQLSDTKAQTITFMLSSIPGQALPTPETLGVYLAPETLSLSSTETHICEFGDDSPECAGDAFPWKILLLYIGVAIFILIILYIIIQEWYKRRYESHLFKNADDLYNIITFIYNSRAGGLGDEDIKKKLLERKWKSEQVKYAFNKIDGKRTGLWEIPLFKFVENKKVKAELEKKQGKNLDVRFIKRQGV